MQNSSLAYLMADQKPPGPRCPLLLRDPDWSGLSPRLQAVPASRFAPSMHLRPVPCLALEPSTPITAWRQELLNALCREDKLTVPLSSPWTLHTGSGPCCLFSPRLGSPALCSDQYRPSLGVLRVCREHERKQTTTWNLGESLEAFRPVSHASGARSHGWHLTALLLLGDSTFFREQGSVL